ncbi:MAG: hypothetical protein M5U01_13480 [Ardenticatenaceae bacterium]|nr:hypothetical protein [Ardenticatenaceae bacterium]
MTIQKGRVGTRRRSSSARTGACSTAAVRWSWRTTQVVLAARSGSRLAPLKSA